MKQILLILSLFYTYTVQAQYAPASNHYSFFVAGHTYGSPGADNQGVHPTFKDKFDCLKSRPEIELGVLTGDIVKPWPDAQDWDEIDADIDSLGIPVYFAVGNHDMQNRPLYEARYGRTYYHFIRHNDLFIVLDPNIDGWNISGDQFTFLDTLVANNHQTVDNIYVFFHQVLWKDHNHYQHITPNSTAGRDNCINFWTEVEPLFHNLSNQVFMFAGDVGAGSWSTMIMYDKYDNISFIASGMGAGCGDNYVVVNVDSNKTVSYNLRCLHENNYDCLGDLTDYQTTIVSPNTILENELDDLQLYPTPASSHIYISSEQPLSNVTMSLYNANGLLMEHKNLTSLSLEQVDLSKVAVGVYYLDLLYEDKRKVLKFVKK